jgi:hypothetical protein
MKDREFPSTDDIEDTISKVRNGLTLEDMQNVVRNWMCRFVDVIESDRK